MSTYMHLSALAGFVLAASLLVGGTGIADDDDGGSFNNLLRGEYAITQLGTCMDTVPGGYDRDTLELLAPAEVTTLQASGIIDFDGNGNFVLTEGRGMAIFHDRKSVGDAPIFAPILFTCDGMYSVKPDRSFEIVGSCFNDEPPFLVNGPFVINGQMSRDRKTLVLGANDPHIEELSIPGFGVIAERICAASATDVRVLNGN